MMTPTKPHAPPRSAGNLSPLSLSLGGSNSSSGKSSKSPSRSLTVRSPFSKKTALRCVGCRIAAGGGLDCVRCGVNAHMRQAHVYDLESGANLTGLDKLHSDWVTPSILAMQRPLAQHLPAVLAQFKGVGITAVFNLTEPGEHPFCGEALDAASGFTYSPEALMAAGVRHFNWSWPDMSSPAVPLLADIVQVANHELDSGAKIAVHCHAGLGRTGIVIAAVLVSRRLRGSDFLALAGAAASATVEPQLESALAPADTTAGAGAGVEPHSQDEACQADHTNTGTDTGTHSHDTTTPRQESVTVSAPASASSAFSKSSAKSAESTEAEGVEGWTVGLGLRPGQLFLSAEQAIRLVRLKRPGSLQTQKQVDVVSAFQRHLVGLREVFTDEWLYTQVPTPLGTGDGSGAPVLGLGLSVPVHASASSTVVGDDGDAGAFQEKDVSGGMATAASSSSSLGLSPCMSPSKKSLLQSGRDQLSFLSLEEVQSFHYSASASTSTSTNASGGSSRSHTKQQLERIRQRQRSSWTLKYLSRLVVSVAGALCVQPWASSRAICLALRNPDGALGLGGGTEASVQLVRMKRACNVDDWTVVQQMCGSGSGSNSGSGILSSSDRVLVLVQLLLDWVDSRADAGISAECAEHLAADALWCAAAANSSLSKVNEPVKMDTDTDTDTDTAPAAAVEAAGAAQTTGRSADQTLNENLARMCNKAQLYLLQVVVELLAHISDSLADADADAATKAGRACSASADDADIEGAYVRLAASLTLSTQLVTNRTLSVSACSAVLATASALSVSSTSSSSSASSASVSAHVPENGGIDCAVQSVAVATRTATGEAETEAETETETEAGTGTGDGASTGTDVGVGDRQVYSVAIGKIADGVRVPVCAVLLLKRLVHLRWQIGEQY